MLEVRPMAAGEAEEACRLVMKVFDEFVAPDFSAAGREVFIDFIRPEALLRRAGSKQSLVLVALLKGRLAGVMEMKGCSHISLYFVEKPLHGRGLARALFDRGLAHCLLANPGIRKITVNSSRYAVPVYRKLGFVQSDCEQVKDGIRFTPMIYTLSIEP